jgi:hypothetical protein
MASRVFIIFTLVSAALPILVLAAEGATIIYVLFNGVYTALENGCLGSLLAVTSVDNKHFCLSTISFAKVQRLLLRGTKSLQGVLVNITMLSDRGWSAHTIF